MQMLKQFQAVSANRGQPLNSVFRGALR